MARIDVGTAMVWVCPQDKVYGDWTVVLMNYLKLNFFFFSPNFTWFAIAAAV
jgi:hypothetical protein